jgi:hypothetical protein
VAPIGGSSDKFLSFYILISSWQRGYVLCFLRSRPRLAVGAGCCLHRGHCRSGNDPTGIIKVPEPRQSHTKSNSVLKKPEGHKFKYSSRDFFSFRSLHSSTRCIGSSPQCFSGITGSVELICHRNGLEFQSSHGCGYQQGDVDEHTNFSTPHPKS